jgi:hypothetical protein
MCGVDVGSNPQKRLICLRGRQRFGPDRLYLADSDALQCLLVHDCLDWEKRLCVHEQLLRHGVAGKFELIHIFAVQC